MDQAVSLELPRSAAYGRKRFLFEVVQTLALMVALFIGVRVLFQNFRVDGPSMQPTLTSGQLLWVNKVAYYRWNEQYILGGPQRGDIAVLHSPDPTDDVDLIKRIIGLPGDSVRVERGTVFINDRPLAEPYIHFEASYTYPLDDHDLVVPAAEYFVLGDNRPNSRDSHFGWFVPAENLIGRSQLSYWPPADWGIPT
ncbi:MAG: signal peptidase I [Chloroflexi bacterium]|nr:signal peptidase I [Chloroflexota bacterium]